MPLAQIDSLWNAQQEAGDKLSSNPFLQEVMQQARNDERFWNEKVLPLQRKLRSKLKSLDETPKPLQSCTYYVHTDHLGTPRELTNNSGDIVWAASYKAWGATANIEQPLTQQTVQVGNTVQTQWVQPLAEEAPEQNLRFQGQYFDEETGLHYNRFRYYDPDCGRYIGQDPIGLQGGENLYLYTPNPTGWLDPLGLAKSSTSGHSTQAQQGQVFHNDMGKHPYPEGYKREQNIPGAGRADAINPSECSVIERKCTCSPRTIKKGEAQLQRYCDALKAQTGQPHQGILEVLDPRTGKVNSRVVVPKK